MTVNMNDITRRIGHWLAMNNIESEGVSVTIEFPDKRAAFDAQMAIKREVEPMMAYHATGGGFGEIKTMNGLGLTLRHR